jgi:transcriptional regulator with XRE-family HTH domain
MAAIGERIALLIKELGLNKNSFSKEIGLKNNSTITNIINNPDRSPSYDIIFRIVTRWDQLNIRWLIAGRGEMFSIAEDSFPNINDRLSHISRKYAITLAETAEQLNVEEEELRKFFYENEAPSAELIKKYISSFSELNPDWVRYNHLPMMSKNTVGDYISPDTLNKMIKTFGERLPSEFENLFNCNNARPAHIVRIESFLECDIALEVFGEDMLPDFIPGEIILCDLVNKNAYIYDLPYIIIADNLNLLRYIKDAGSPDTILLVPPNGDKASIEIKQSDIKQLFLVKGKIRRYYS